MNSQKLARYAVEMGMEQIEKQIDQEMRLPPELLTDLKVILTGAGEKPDHAKLEGDLRMD